MEITNRIDNCTFDTLAPKEKKAFVKASLALHKRHHSVNKTFNLDFLLLIIGALIAAFALRQFVFEPTRVDGKSMQPTLMNRERVLVEKVSYMFSKPKRGDIVIVHYPDRTQRFVKRVIALGGETIEIRSGYIYINGERLDESAYAGDWDSYGKIIKGVRCLGSENGVYTVPENHYFVIGDNRNDSHDSRDDYDPAYNVGAIPAEQVLGRGVAVVWPIAAIRGVKK